MLMCPQCFDKQGLQRRIREIRPTFNEGKCHQHLNNKGVPSKAVAEILSEVILNNFYLPGYDYRGRQMGFELADLVYSLTGCSNDTIALELQSALIDNQGYVHHDDIPFFSDEEGYLQISNDYDARRAELWTEFCAEIKGKQRFFNRTAQKFLEEIFSGLHLLKDHNADPAICTLQPTTTRLFRARRANNAELQKRITNNISLELGPPPEKLRTAGRMNPSGIASFYCAFDLDTCFAELRPSVGESVMAAQFEILRPIHVLDTTKFESPTKPEDLFGKRTNRQFRHWAFMSNFMREISRPCLPNDEHIDYIPTQVVAEYLIHLYRGKKMPLEGIIFPSAQHVGGKNLVLFGDATSVKHEVIYASSSEEIPNTKNGSPTLQVVSETLVTERIVSVNLSREHIPEDFFADLIEPEDY